MKALMICNPGARAGRSRKLWPRWREQLEAGGLVTEQAVTKTPADAGRLAAETDADIAVAVGGDGTISRVIHGVVASGRDDLGMGVLYAGTSPDFCRFHAIPTDPERAVATILDGCVRAVDVGHIRFGGGRAHFGCGVNIGLGPDVARRANRLRPYLGDAIGTGTAAVHSICTTRRAALTLRIDGQTLPQADVNNLSVVLNPHLASGLRLDLPLTADDGKLAVVAVCNQGRAGLLRLLPAFYSGRIVDYKDVLVRVCEHIEIDGDDHLQVEFDGDPRGRLPAEIRVLPQRLRLICPRLNGTTCHV